MSTPLHNEMAAAMAGLREQQTRITDAIGRLQSASTTVTSDDRLIEATVDGQGKLTGLKLAGRRWRDLAPKEFAARLIDVVSRAQDKAAQNSAELVSGLMPGGMDLDQLRNTAPDLDAMLSAALQGIDGRRVR